MDWLPPKHTRTRDDMRLDQGSTHRPGTFPGLESNCNFSFMRPLSNQLSHTRQSQTSFLKILGNMHLRIFHVFLWLDSSFNFLKNFYCYSIIVVCIFPPSLHPTRIILQYMGVPLNFFIYSSVETQHSVYA